MLWFLALFLQSLKEEGFNFFLIILITSLSEYPDLFFISSKVMRSAQAAHTTQSGLIEFGSGFLTFVMGL
mgnify:CR=1 FL=1